MDKYGGIFHEVFGSVGKFFDDEIWAEGGYSCRIHVFSIGRTVRKNGKSFPFHDTVGWVQIEDWKKSGLASISFGYRGDDLGEFRAKLVLVAIRDTRMAPALAGYEELIPFMEDLLNG